MPGMSGQSILIILFVGAVAGWLAGLVVRGFGFGLIGNIVVGILGAFVAHWLLSGFNIAPGAGPVVGSIIYSTIGAVILLVVIALIRRV